MQSPPSRTVQVEISDWGVNAQILSWLPQEVEPWPHDRGYHCTWHRKWRAGTKLYMQTDLSLHGMPLLSARGVSFSSAHGHWLIEHCSGPAAHPGLMTSTDGALTRHIVPVGLVNMGTESWKRMDWTILVPGRLLLSCWEATSPVLQNIISVRMHLHPHELRWGYVPKFTPRMATPRCGHELRCPVQQNEACILTMDTKNNCGYPRIPWQIRSGSSLLQGKE